MRPLDTAARCHWLSDRRYQPREDRFALKLRTSLTGSIAGCRAAPGDRVVTLG